MLLRSLLGICWAFMCTAQLVAGTFDEKKSGGTSAAEDVVTDEQEGKEKESGEDDDDQMRAEMKRRMQEVEVIVIGKDKSETKAQLHPTPVFRYNDQAREIEDGTVWVWVADGRPVAMQKLEAFMTNSTAPLWTHCFTTLSADLVKASWPEETFEATAAVTYTAIPEAGAPDENAVKRKFQIRQLSRRFSAVSGRRSDKMMAMRTMPRPIFEFADSAKMPLGAIFGLEANGTNPDMVLIISAMPNKSGELSWHYGITRMTDTSAKIMLDDVEVLTTPNINARVTNKFDNWMFFYTDRTLMDGERKKSE